LKKYWILILILPLFGLSQSATIDDTQQNKSQTKADSLIKTLFNKSDKEKISSLLDYGKMYCNNNPGLSIRLVEKAHKLAKETGDPLLISTALNGLAVLNYYKGNNEIALSLFLQAIDYVNLALEQNPDSTFLLKRLQIMNNNVGCIFNSMGEFEKSLQKHQNALRLGDTLIQLQPGNTQNVTLYIKTVNNTAVLYWKMGEQNKATQLLGDALKMARDHNDRESIIFTLNNIGLIQIDKEEYRQAISSYKEALIIEKQMNDSIAIGGNYNNMGLIMEKTGNLTEALSYYLKSLQISQRLGYSIGISNTCANAGKIYSEMDKPDSALYFVNMGIDEAIRSGDKTYLLKNYETLYQIYEKLGKNSEALKAYKNFVSVKDSIFNTEKSQQIAEMEAKYETEKKEKENQLLLQNIEIQKQTALLLIISIVALVILILFLYYFYRLKNKTLQQKSKIFIQERKLQELEKSHLEDQLFAEQQINKLQNEKLEQQNRELSSRVLHAINKNEAMNNIILELEQLKEIGNHDINQCFNKVSHIVKNNISMDKEWEQFKLHFEEVNPGFFNSLQEKYPELTQNELKLCAYYRINLNTKEIAKMLNVTNAAIQKSRYRLRKKMDISSETELPEFMSRF